MWEGRVACVVAPVSPGIVFFRPVSVCAPVGYTSLLHKLCIPSHDMRRGAPRCVLSALCCSARVHAARHSRCTLLPLRRSLRAHKHTHTHTHIRCSNCKFRAALTMVSVMATVVPLVAKVNPLHRWLHHSIPLSHTLRNPPLDYTRALLLSHTHAHTHTHTRCPHTHTSIWLPLVNGCCHLLVLLSAQQLQLHFSHAASRLVSRSLQVYCWISSTS